MVIVLSVRSVKGSMRIDALLPRLWRSGNPMNQVDLKVFVLTFSWLLATAAWSFPQTSSKIPTHQNQTSVTSSKASAQGRQLAALPIELSQAGVNQWATVIPSETASHYNRNIRAFLLQEMASSFDPTQAGAPQQTKPAATNQPSLKDLGFPSGAIQGSSKEQELLDKRSHMLQIHQKLGLLTTIPMVAAVFTGPGAKGHHGLPGSPTGRDVHMGLGILTTGMYFTSAYFAIRAPKIPETKSYGLIRLHKALAWVHGPGMILTPILGSIAFSQLSKGERVHGIAKYHSWAAYTTVAAYGAAILSVTLK